VLRKIHPPTHEKNSLPTLRKNCLPNFGKNTLPSTFPDFAHIAFTLGFSSGTVNGVGYDGVLMDNVISEDETQYIVALRNDIAIIVSDMQSADNVDQNLSIRQINAILNEFFRKWSYHDENSPFFLLHN